MLNCPKCDLLTYNDNIKNCVLCGSKLEKIMDKIHTEHTISVRMDFTIHECDNCNNKFHYGIKLCPSCKTPLPIKKEKLYDLDPIVEKRKKELSNLLDFREKIIRQLPNIKQSSSELKEEEYRQKYLELSESYQEYTKSIRTLLETINFSGSTLDSSEFKKNLENLIKLYLSLYEITIKIKEITPHHSWNSIHQSFVTLSEKTTISYFDIIDILISDNPNQALHLMKQINNSLDKYGNEFERIGNIVIAGKKIRYEMANLPEAMAYLANEEMDLNAWQKLGFDYFKEVFEKDIKDQSELGFALPVWAITIESFNNPKLLIKRVSEITILLRQADKINRTYLKSANDGVKDDIIHATRLMYDISQIIYATDFSKLHIQQKFDILIRAYQRLSEGVFKNLITILLYSEQIVDGKKPNYDKIRKKSFGFKIWKCLKNSKKTLIAGLADDLKMYIRHADAHCDFYSQGEKIIVNERDYPKNNIINQHEYSEQEFVVLIQRLVEAVFSILIGIRCFQFEFSKDYLSEKVEDMFDYEKLEIVKYIFASKGAIVETIEQVFSKDNEPCFKLKIILSPNSVKKPDILLIPKSSLYSLFPESTNFITELFDINNNLIGTINIPTSHYKKFQKMTDNSRARELIILNLTYKTYTQYSDSPKIFNEDNNNEKLFWKYFLKGTIMYLHYIIADCYKSISFNKKEISTFINVTNQVVLLFEEILSSTNPPNSFKIQYKELMNSIQPLKQFIQKLKYYTKTGAKNKKKKKLESILNKSNSYSISLLNFAQNMEDNNEKLA